jgi:hypothetical protein
MGSSTMGFRHNNRINLPTARRHGAAKLHHPRARAIVTPTVFGTGMVLGFGCLLFDSLPIFIAKDASIFKRDEH